MDRMWTEQRYFLRPFRGAGEWHLADYVAMFEGQQPEACTDAS
jgi:hypothetical protein